MSNLLPVCLLLFVVSATVIAYPAEQAGNFVDLDELFNFENAPIEPAENVAFDREEKRRHASASCKRECTYCAKIHTRYSLGRCFRTCMTGKTDYKCANRMHFV